mgnify:CR=1 FL=1
MPRRKELPKRDALIEKGYSGLRLTTGRVWEDFDRSLRGIQAVRMYEEMRRNDPVLGAVNNAIDLVLRGVLWNVMPASEETASQEAADFVTSCMGDISHSWNDFVSEILTFIPFGWAYFEVTYKERRGELGDPTSNYDDGKIGWRKIALRGQESLDRWEIDEHGGIQGMWQRPDMYAGTVLTSVMVPIEKALLFRTKREKNNPEGYSFYRNAVRPYTIKKGLEDIETIGFNRDLTGIPIVRMPQGATDEDYNKAKNIVERMQADEQAGLVFEWHGEEKSENWDVSLLGAPGGSKASDLNQAIQRVSGEISMVFLAQFLRQGQQRVGSYAMVKEFKDLFHLALSSLLDNIRETKNRFLLPPLMRLNGIPHKLWPTLEHDPIAEADIQGLADFVQKLSQAGLMTYSRDLENSLRRQADLPELVEAEAGAASEDALRWASEYMEKSR